MCVQTNIWKAKTVNNLASSPVFVKYRGAILQNYWL